MYGCHRNKNQWKAITRSIVSPFGWRLLKPLKSLTIIHGGLEIQDKHVQGPSNMFSSCVHDTCPHIMQGNRLWFPPGAGLWRRTSLLGTHLSSLLSLLVSPQFQTAPFAWTSGRGRRRGFWGRSRGRSWAVRRERAGRPLCWNPRPTPTDPAEETRLRASGETKEAYTERQRCLVEGGRKGEDTLNHLKLYTGLCAVRNKTDCVFSYVIFKAGRISLSACDVMYHRV